MLPYLVEDQYADPVPITDAWAAFLSARFSKRKELYDGFSSHDKEIVRKELRRIRFLREYFFGHRLSQSDRITLLISLENAHRRWRDYASQRCKDDLPRVEVDIARTDKQRRQLLNRSRLILKQVQQWPSQQYADLRQSVAPESFIQGLESADDIIDDNPGESNYGYNGWIIAFKKGQGGINLDNSLCHGKFPHQKIAVQKLLYDKENTPLKRSSDKTQLRYFHLQANNMKWVEDAVARYYEEDETLFESHRGLQHRKPFVPGAKKTESNTERLLKRELWHGQERGGGDTHMAPHARQIRPRCALISSPKWKTPASQSSSTALPGTAEYPHSATGSNDIVLFMPYLHWEIEKRLVRMTNVIRKTRQMNEEHFALERISKRRGTWGSVVERARARARRMNSTTSEFADWDEDSPSWRPQSPLGIYLWAASKLYQLIDEAADWRLIDEHLQTASPLHTRRTLEQYYYWTAEDTTHRDRQQVVYRATKTRSDPEAIPRVVMVDQLWLWILDENTILTAFPRRWGRNKPDPSAVHRAIRDHVQNIDGNGITSIYDLALIIIDECSKVFFDRTKPDLRPEVVDMFGSAISSISEKKSEAYERFGRDVKKMNSQDPLQTTEELLRKSLNIKFEWSVLMEAQNLIDQLQIMQEIFTQQITVVTDFERALRGMTPEVPDGFKSAVERAADLIAEMKLRRDELNNLERRQANTRSQLRELLDMKQQQSGIIEAKAAIRRADESVVQGRSIVVFTVVTIFFLPLSFFATLFGMNSTEMNDGSKLHLSTQLTLMFVLSSVVIFASLALAFNTAARGAVFSAFKACFGWMTVNRKKKVDSAHLTGASPHALKEFMIEKQREWEIKNSPTVAVAASGALPMHQNTGRRMSRASTIGKMWRWKSI
ncbi:hypothetical protein QBC38DRAFT_269104 [Podospora fimiseda]|uniref:Uncharacterized protein n=1 Tax=Podospora fimiseda TaxID=252190 RepID=A0AAN7H0Q0_9PEZI|nr:hypothetical protein QBC38DRAFT_269104 [Podospora fimiseda]